MTIWVTGAAGMLGQEVIAKLSKFRGTRVLCSDRDVDITNTDSISAFLEAYGDIDWIVNCAAWTAVDDAENHEAAAHSLNADGPRILAQTAKKRNAAIVHISTDYVFSGRRSRPYQTDDAPEPLSAYGRTKLEGEKAVSAANRDSIILRTAWLYGEGGRNFVYSMLRLMKERKEIGVVSDQRGLPTFAPNLARVIAQIVARSHSLEAPPWGIYHYTDAPDVGEELRGISWFDFACEIYKRGRDAGLLKGDCTINALTTDEYPAMATRPTYALLDCNDIINTFDIIRPIWRSGLGEFISSIKESNV